MSPKKKPKDAAAGTLLLELPESAESLTIPDTLPLLPLRDVVVFPRATMPLFVGRARSVAALEEAIDDHKILFAVTQRRPETTRPAAADLHLVGTLVRVLQLFRLPDGTMRILVEGLARARMEAFTSAAESARATVQLFPEKGIAVPRDAAALVAEVKEAFGAYVERNPRVPPEVGLVVRGVTDPLTLSYKVAAHLQVDVALRQRLLESPRVDRRLRELAHLLESQLEQLRERVRREGAARTAPEVAGADAAFDDPEAARGPLPGAGEFGDELEEIAQAIEQAGMPQAAEEKAFRELDRLSKMSLMSPEATVCRSYLDCLTNIPWRQRTRDRTDLKRVQQILDEDHYGLRKVKERVLEQISVIKLSREVRGPILCFTGPPGVGKTSLGRSIARAIGRRFVRMSLGGIRDESEIRGHRRTYIGSLPGRIIQAMRKAGTINPVILLDEVDKLGSDHRGDPAAALLEVLDPEQNVAFNDHYLEVDYDLSKVLFITTANLLHAIPEPLRDRMEVIRIPGYLETEKIQIARRFLLPRQRKANGLAPGDLDLAPETLARLVRDYTREAGVRNLEREIARLCRRVAKVKAGGKDAVFEAPRTRRRTMGISVAPEQLRQLLGPARQNDLTFERASRVGLATGLAWTTSGGELLAVEAGVLPGRGTLVLTGQLGDTMRESAQAALSTIRSRSEVLGLDRGFYRRVDIHIHVPEGAVPKDGPSAGVTLALALASALTGIATRPGLALTGEITLRGHVLPVGGLGEKLVAARRVGITEIAVPRGNMEHIAELPRDLTAGLTLHPVATIDEVLALGLEVAPGALRAGAADAPPLAA